MPTRAFQDPLDRPSLEELDSIVASVRREFRTKYKDKLNTSEQLLHQMLPPHVAAALRDGRKVSYCHWTCFLSLSVDLLPSCFSSLPDHTCAHSCSPVAESPSRIALLQVEPQLFECVTIFFSDIVGYTDMTATMRPEKVMDLLDRLYQRFDKLSRKHGLFKVETIGDA